MPERSAGESPRTAGRWIRSAANFRGEWREGHLVSHLVNAQFIRYSAVGATATLAHYLLLVACVEVLGWPAWWASGAGAVLGAQVAYFGNHHFTFSPTTARRASWPRFQLVALAGGLLGMLVVGAAVRLGVHYLAAQVLATVLVLLLGFALNRWWTFR